MPIRHYLNEKENQVDTYLDFGFGDIGNCIGKTEDKTRLLFGFQNLSQAYGVGGVTTQGDILRKHPDVTLTFPTDSPDCLDILITALELARDKYYPEAERKFTKDTNCIRPNPEGKKCD